MERRVRWKEKKEGSHVRGGALLSSTKKRQRVNHPRDEIRLLSPLFSFLNQGIISTMHRSNPNKFINEKKTKCLVTSSWVFSYFLGWKEQGKREMSFILSSFDEDKQRGKESLPTCFRLPRSPPSPNSFDRRSIRKGISLFPVKTPIGRFHWHCNLALPP